MVIGFEILLSLVGIHVYDIARVLSYISSLIFNQLIIAIINHWCFSKVNKMLNYPKGILRYFSCPLLSIILMHLLSCLLLENKLSFTLILMAKFSLKKLSRILSMLLPCRLLVILLFLKLDKADSQYLIWKIMSFLTLNTCLPGKNQI